MNVLPEKEWVFRRGEEYQWVDHSPGEEDMLSLRKLVNKIKKEAVKEYKQGIR
jgi:hypothetical protein